MGAKAMEPLDVLIGAAFAACVGPASVGGLAGLGLAGVTALLMLGDLAGPKG